MFELPWALKQDIEDLKRKTENVVKDISSGTQQTFERVKFEARNRYPDIVSKLSRLEGRIHDDFGTFEDLFLDKILSTYIKRHKTMKHKVIMLGGRRAGKSTILASILELLKETPGSICTITDVTDYTQKIIGDDGLSHPIPTLAEKKREVAGYMKDKTSQMALLVDMSPNVVDATYTLQVSSNGNTVNLEFVDVPGEWMRQNSDDYKELKEIVNASDVFIVAIDTPFLMQDEVEKYDQDVNDVYNRVSEITNILTSEIRIETDGIDKKLILLCPVKCEKWVHSGRINEVSEKVKVVYKDIANRWLSGNHANDVEIRIMPISTVGGLDSYKLLPAKRYYKDDNDQVGISCSEDAVANVLLQCNGHVIRPRKGSFLEDDETWKIDYNKIPLSWYKVNGKGFKPQFCEQPGYHILRFLVNKEENVIRNIAETQRQRLNVMNPIFRWLTQTFVPTFGRYLPVWNDVIVALINRGLIKEDGDGFMRITEPID